MSDLSPVPPSLPAFPLPLRSTSVPAALAALTTCVQACLRLAEACTPAPSGSGMSRSAKLSTECAAVCAATINLLERAEYYVLAAQRRQLLACIAACSACESECDIYAMDHDQCRVCAVACRRAAASCRVVEAEVAARGL